MTEIRDSEHSVDEMSDVADGANGASPERVTGSEDAIAFESADQPEPAGQPWWRRTGLAGVSVPAGVYLVIAMSALIMRAPLGHDESVYALRARDFTKGWGTDAGVYWADYRAPGLSMLIAAMDTVVDARVVMMRALTVMLGLVVIVATYLAVSRLAGQRAAVGAAGILALTAGFAGTSTRLLADTPGAAFAMVAFSVFVSDLHRNSLHRSLVAVPLLTIASTVSRFGAPIMLAAGLGAAGLVALPRLLRERRWSLLGQAAGLAALVGIGVGLIVFTSLITVGPGSPASANQSLFESKGLTPSTGFSDLWNVTDPWTDYPNTLWSKPVFFLWCAGLFLALIGVALRAVPWQPVAIGVLAGAVSTVGIAASVGLVVENYLLLTMPFWAMAVGAGFGWLAGLVARAPRPASVAVGAVAAIALAVISLGTARDVRDYHHQLNAAFGPLRSVSGEVDRQLGDDCVVITSYTPQVGFYSGCRIVPWRVPIDNPPADQTPSVAAGEAVQAVPEEVSLLERLGASLEHGQNVLAVPPVPGQTTVVAVGSGKRQPSDELLEDGAGLAERFSVAGEPADRRQYVWSALIDECVFDGSCEG